MSTTTVTTTMPDVASKGEVKARELTAALKAITLFASTDATIPVLCHVALVADGTTLTLKATDRYVAGRYTIDYAGEPFAVSVHRTDVATILALLKPWSGARSDATATLTMEGVRLTVATYDTSGNVATGDIADLPKIDSLFPSEDGASLPDGTIAFNPAYLAKFAKVADKHEPMRLYMKGAMKPALVKIGEHFTGLIMPMHIAG